MEDAETFVVAIDIGGTKTAAALVDRSGVVLDRESAPTPGGAGPDAVRSGAAALARALCARNPARRVVAAGVGSAGVVDPDTGVVLAATDVLRDWAGTSLRARLADALEVPVAVRNDVHAHGLGEARHGAGAGRASVIYIAVGTGIGAAFIHVGLRGDLLTGAHAAAGHAGHLPSRHAGDLPCTCGGSGHLEAIAAGPALVREYQRRTGASICDLRAVAQLATAGDPEAVDVLELGGTAVGSVVGGLINMLDPELVVIGGGVAALGPHWWEPLRRAAAADALPSLRETPVVPSALDHDAALLGAATVAWTLVDGGSR